MSKYGDFSGPYFPVFAMDLLKYGPEKTLYLGNFHAVLVQQILTVTEKSVTIIR